MANGATEWYTETTEEGCCEPSYQHEKKIVTIEEFKNSPQELMSRIIQLRTGTKGTG